MKLANNGLIIWLSAVLIGVALQAPWTGSHGFYDSNFAKLYAATFGIGFLFIYTLWANSQHFSYHFSDLKISLLALFY